MVSPAQINAARNKLASAPKTPIPKGPNSIPDSTPWNTRDEVLAQALTFIQNLQTQINLISPGISVQEGMGPVFAAIEQLRFNGAAVADLGSGLASITVTLPDPADVLQAANLGTTAALPGAVYTPGAAADGSLDTYSFTAGAVDGVVPVVGNRVLVKDSTLLNAPGNGVWVVTAVGATVDMERATDYRGPVTPQKLIGVISGTENGNKYFTQSSPDTNPVQIGGPGGVATVWTLYPVPGAGLLPAQMTSGRLTLSPTDPIPTADVASSPTLYLLPYQGNQILLYNGTSWVFHTIPPGGVSRDNTLLAANRVYDVFAQEVGGAITLGVQIWTNDTTRATPLAQQDGVYVNSLDATQLYLGSVRTNAATEYQDDNAGRWVWNYYNRVWRSSRTQEPLGTSWSQAAAGWTTANGGGANWIHSILVGIVEDKVDCAARCYTSFDNDGAAAQERGAIGVGLDLDTAPAADSAIATPQLFTGGGGTNIRQDTIEARYNGYPGLGVRTLFGITAGPGGGNTSNYFSSALIGGVAANVSQMVTSFRG